MKLKKYVKLSILAIGLSVSAIEVGALDSTVTKVYAKKKTVKKAKKKVKKDKKVLKNFKAVVEGDNNYGTAFYTDSKNNKIYISVEDFFGNLVGTTKEAKISVNTNKKTVKVSSGKKYKNKYTYIDLPKSIYGKPENIKLDIDGNKTEIKGYVVKSDSYWSKDKVLYADFD